MCWKEIVECFLPHPLLFNAPLHGTMIHTSKAGWEIPLKMLTHESYTLTLVTIRQGHWELYWCDEILRTLVYGNEYFEGQFVVQLIPEIWKQGDLSALKILSAFFGIKGLRYDKGHPIFVITSAKYPVIFNCFTWLSIATFLSDILVVTRSSI